MSVLSFPITIPERRETIETFFPRFNSDPKDSSIRSALNKHDYESLSKNQVQKYLSLDDKIIAMNLEIRLAREERDRLWEEELRNPMVDARKIVAIFNEKNPMASIFYGFKPKAKSSKKAPTEKTVEKHLKRAAATANSISEAKALAVAMKEAKANVQKSSSMASVTVNDVTRVVGV
jgi:phosphoribosylformylglycinamidine (FGAM) synthase PurS component